MAVEVTRVFKRYPELYDKEMGQFVEDENSFFDADKLFLVRSVSESKAINNIKGTIVIMAGSGMCTGGRIKHHLVTNISRPESTILFPGYQAQGTLGRHIVSGADTARILGKRYKIKAKIVQIDGFSAHADLNELQKWLSSLRKPPRHVFVTHGELEAAESFAGLIENNMGWKVSVPEYLDEVNLD